MYRTITAAFATAAALATFATGCACPGASYVVNEACTSAPRETAQVEVLLDQEPARPFRVMGELRASTVEQPQSLALMRQEAARQGLDGIYWIECADQAAGRCKAKGFVYTSDVGSAVATTATR